MIFHCIFKSEWDLKETKPPDDWPESGKIEFINYEMKYRKELEPVLKGINLLVKPGEKVGICGRTGMHGYSCFIENASLVIIT